MTTYVVLGQQIYSIDKVENFPTRVFTDENEALDYLREIKGENYSMTEPEETTLYGYPVQYRYAIASKGFSGTGFVNPQPSLLIVEDRIGENVLLLMDLDKLSRKLKYNQIEIQDLEIERKSIGQQIRDLKKRVGIDQKKFDELREELVSLIKDRNE